MNAIALLEDDHEKVKKILDELESTTERGVKTREELFGKLRAELSVHERIEEEIFYPALRGYKKAKDIVLEGYEEHHAVDVLLEELASVSFDDETWGPKLTVIKENIEHHIEEEEGDMFVKARQVLEEEELEELGAMMESRRNQMKSAA
jgi:hypothetical protein